MGWLTLLGPVISRVVEKVLPGETSEDRAKRMELELELQKAMIEADNKQVEVNIAEAQTGNLFIAGWRPAIGWICVIAFSVTYFFKPLIDYFLILKGLPTLPELNTSELNTILMGMLGLGGLRTFEKIKGVDGLHEIKGLPWLNKK